MLDSQAVLSVVEIIFYIPALIACNVLLYRHGFSWLKSKWLYYLIILSVIRITRSCIDIRNQNERKTPNAASAVLGGLGLSPLLLSIVALLDKAATNLQKKRIATAIKLLHIPEILAMILLVVGGKKAFGTDPSQTALELSLTRASIILFLLIFLTASSICFFLFTTTRKWAPEFDVYCLLAIVVSIPILEVRIISGCISFFDPVNRTFSIVNGSLAVQVLMVTIPEFLITIIGIGVGIFAPPKAQTSVRQTIRRTKTEETTVYMRESTANLVHELSCNDEEPVRNLSPVSFDFGLAKPEPTLAPGPGWI